MWPELFRPPCSQWQQPQVAQSPAAACLLPWCSGHDDDDDDDDDIDEGDSGGGDMANILESSRTHQPQQQQLLWLVVARFVFGGHGVGGRQCARNDIMQPRPPHHQKDSSL